VAWLIAAVIAPAMKIKLFLTLLAFALCPIAHAAPTTVLYDGEKSPAIDDLKMALEDYNAGTIQFEKTDLGMRTGQEFYLVKKGDKTYIKYTVETSLENAVYTLLDEWGFHWYGPGENWFVKPKTIPAADIPGAWISPTFRNRTFFGTGGLSLTMENRAFDPKNDYWGDWIAWKRRNRFNADYKGAGHAGQAFYLDNKELLDKHPEWFSSDAGKQNGRLKIEIPEAVEAYKAWIKKKYANATDPFISIGVDPEDGRGGADDPLPPDGFDGIEHWNHADKWWWLANEVASDYPEDDKHIVVTMYAYGDGSTNALAPRFDLRKNVYPVIIPYAFQTAYLPQEMVKVWAAKIGGNMGLYDYWNITQWSVGMPGFYLYGMKDKLKFWHDNKVDGTYIETTAAAGPMGHAWWISGQLQFDLSEDFNALYQQYLNDCFGKGAPAMKKMYDRWSNNNQGAGEVSLSLADLKAAEDLVEKDSPEWKRINELKAYVHFMKLWYEHDGTQENKDKIFAYLYSIHPLMMVQTAAFIGQWYIPPFDKGNVVPVGTAKHLTPAEIDANFEQDLKTNPKLYDVSNFQFDYKKAYYTEPMDNEAWIAGRSTVVYFVPPVDGVASFDAGTRSDKEYSKAATDLAVFTDDGVALNEKVGAVNFDYEEKVRDFTYAMKKISLPVKAGKKYFVRFKGSFNRFKMNSDLIVYNAHNSDDFDNYGYPTQYLYVPKDCDEIIFEDKEAIKHGGSGFTGAFHAIGKKWNEYSKDEYGIAIGIKDLYRVKVKPKWKGTVIACNFGHTNWSLKNLPDVLAMQPFEYDEE
jgi:hypothetical protein